MELIGTWMQLKLNKVKTSNDMKMEQLGLIKLPHNYLQHLKYRCL